MTDEVRCNASDDDLHQVRCGGVREGADKQRLEQQLAELNLVLNQQAAYIATLETENAQRAAKGTTYLDLIKALNDANQQLEANVATLDQKVQARTKEYNDQLWQYNRSVVLMNSVRAVLVDLTTGNDAEARRVRTMFAQRYGEQISDAIRTGALRTPLESDPEFAKNLPRSQQFLVEMLKCANTQPQAKEGASCIAGLANKIP
jgi:SMC interacting uncharacterized protein involved in chromosome segregation